MAGCAPRYMPALVAAVGAFLDPAFGAHSVQTTTNPVGPMVLFNGPIRRELDLNCGAGCFGPGRRANATIGRALRLVMLNIGGAVPGEVDKAPLGWPGKYTSVCFGEDEEESPYEPYHVEKGFRPEDSTVTLIPVNGMWPITETSPEAEMVLHHVTHGMAASGHSAGEFVPEPFHQLLVMSPVIAHMVAELKPTKRELKQHLFDHARIPLSWYPAYRYPGTRRYLSRHDLGVQDDLIPITQSPEGFIVLVAGGNGGLQSCGLSTMLGFAVTRKIESPLPEGEGTGVRECPVSSPARWP
jgi:hypothetical protein